jgi:hypothetical protein
MIRSFIDNLLGLCHPLTMSSGRNRDSTMPSRMSFRPFPTASAPHPFDGAFGPEHSGRGELGSTEFTEVRPKPQVSPIRPPANQKLKSVWCPRFLRFSLDYCNGGVGREWRSYDAWFGYPLIPTFLPPPF